MGDTPDPSGASIDKAIAAAAAELKRQSLRSGCTTDIHGDIAQVDGSFRLEPLVCAVIAASSHAVAAEASARLRSGAATSLGPAEAKRDKPGNVRGAHSVTSLAEYWGVSTGHIYTLIKSGELRHFKLGGTLYRIPFDAVEEYERDHSA